MVLPVNHTPGIINGQMPKWYHAIGMVSFSSLPDGFNNSGAIARYVSVAITARMCTILVAQEWFMIAQRMLKHVYVKVDGGGRP
jgi:hypothetical protein